LGAFYSYANFIPIFEGQVLRRSRISVQDMILRLPLMTPEHKFAEQKRLKKQRLSA
jgi:hypothetical protein